MLKKLVATLAAVLVAFVAAAALYVYDSGFAMVQIRDGHRSFTVPVPLVVAEVGLVFAARSQVGNSGEILEQCRRVLPVVLTELEKSSDVTFVDIVNGRDSVQVEKAGSDLIVNIESQDEKVRVRAPVRSLTRILRRTFLVSAEQVLPGTVRF